MTFDRALLRCFGNIGTFHGRSGRREFWWYALFASVAVVGLAALADLAEVARLGLVAEGVIALAASTVLAPLPAVTVRRLHDVNCPGSMVLVALLPVVGQVALLHLLSDHGQFGPNRFGGDPRSYYLHMA